MPSQNLFERIFDKLSNDTQVDRLCTCGPLVIDMFNVCGIKGISKISFFNFSGTESVKQNLKN